MTRTTTNSVGQPSLEDLTVRFLASRSDAAATAVELGEGDVEPHEVASGFRVDPLAAWSDATSFFTAATVPPPDWGTLVNHGVAAFAVPLAAGNFPQRVRDAHPLVVKFEPSTLRPTGGQPPLPGLTSLRAWIAKEKAAQPLLAAGLARLLGDFDIAEKLLTGADTASKNEQAALLWHRGRCEEALAVWSALPESPTVWFNRGMALLFLGQLHPARAVLQQAISTLPEDSGWNSLARLYLAVAEIHGGLE